MAPDSADAPPDNKGKFKRKSGPRTRNGCLTCNFVKCDGYAPVIPRRRSRESSASSGVGSSSSSSSLMRLSPPIIIDIRGPLDERRSFHHFRIRTSDCISGYFTSNFWDKLVLQLGHAEPAIKHALIALGAAHEQYEHGMLPSSSNGQLALKQYSKAINSLNQRLSNPDGRSAEVALICCVLFICLESVQGNFLATLNHLQNGLNILKDWRANGRRMITADGSMAEVPYLNAKTDEDELVRLFSRLDISITAFLDNGPPQLIKEIEDPESFFDSTGKFYSLDHSHIVMQKLSNAVFNFMSSCYLFRGVPANQVPTKVKKMHHSLIRSFYNWGVQFDSLLKTPKLANLSGKELQGTCMLVIHQKTLTIMLKAAPYDGVDMFDGFDEDFRGIISLVSGVLESEASLKAAENSDPRPKRPSNSFRFDMGLIAPLYYVAINCRDSQIRYQAIALLYSCHRREGVWDSQMVAHLCERVVELSEAGEFDPRNFEGGLPNIAETFKSSTPNTTDLSSLTALSKMEVRGIYAELESVNTSLVELCSREYALCMESVNRFLGEDLDSVTFEADDTLRWS